MVVALAVVAADVAPVVTPVRKAGTQSGGSRGHQVGSKGWCKTGQGGQRAPTEVQEPHVLLQRPPHPKRSALRCLDLPEQGSAHVGRPEGCSWRGAYAGHGRSPGSSLLTAPGGAMWLWHLLGSKCTSTMARTDLPGPRSRRWTLRKSCLTSEFRNRWSSCGQGVVAQALVTPGSLPVQGHPLTALSMLRAVSPNSSDLGSAISGV